LNKGNKMAMRIYALKVLVLKVWASKSCAFVIARVVASCLLACAPATETFGQIRIKAVGDVLLGSYTPQRFIPPGNGSLFADSIGGYLRGADVVFGNFEAAFAREDMKPQKCAEASRRKGVCFEFGTPLALAPALKQLGFTVMSVDNNHADDYGAEGAELTKQTLREQGIAVAPKRGLATLEAKGKRCAVIAFGFSETSYNVSDIATAQKVVREAKRSFDRVIVSFHGGAEGKNALRTLDKTEMFYGENRGNLVRFARAAVDAGADIVLGHGPHVLRAMELYKDRLIAYSLGNFLTYGNINIKGVSGVACILEARLDEETGVFVGGAIIPVVQRAPGVPVYDAEKQAIRIIRDLAQSDMPSSTLRIADDGTLTK
jgi:hypothetical protein